MSGGRLLALALVTVASAVGCGGTDASDEPVAIRGLTMGTTFDVEIDADMSAAERADARALVEGTLAHVERLMSTYDTASELSRFNRHAGVDPIAVSDDVLRVLTTALEVGGRSDGAFDVTVGPLVDAWGFGPDGAPAHPPDSARVALLLERVGPGRLVVDPKAGTVAKTHPDTRVDLSAIAKGYGVEQVAARLVERGYGSVLVEVGGEVQAVGTRRDGSRWRVGIERPGGDGLHGTVELTDQAVATSGDYRNFYDDGGTAYAHIIDPRTGRPIPSVGVAVSVVHPSATEADAWATALSVLGVEQGYDLAVREGIAALFVWRSEAGSGSRATPELLSRVDALTEAPTR